MQNEDKLKMLKEDLPVVGECDVTIENETRTTNAKIIIIQGKMDCLPTTARMPNTRRTGNGEV